MGGVKGIWGVQLKEGAFTLGFVLVLPRVPKVKIG